MTLTSTHPMHHTVYFASAKQALSTQNSNQ